MPTFTHTALPESDAFTRQMAATAQDATALLPHLAQTLHSSLDLHEILALFYRTLHSMVRCSGMEYRFGERQIQLSLGVHKKHSARYGIQHAGQSLGELVFFRQKAFEERELTLLETCLTLLVIPLRNGLLYKEALDNSLRDSLTQVGNRAGLELALRRELKLAQRNALPLSLIVVDIDHFKRINDYLGHSGGDQFLQHTARILTQTLRQTDQIFRYGGEEFVIVLSGAGADEARNIAERMRKAVAEQALSTSEGTLAATISLGVSTSNDQDNRDTLFDRADKALYQAKHQGRNRVIFYTTAPAE